MANKNPYEIRADLLVLAQRICFDRHCAEHGTLGTNVIRSAPTTEEIITEAEKLNKFVSDSPLRN